MARLTDDVEHKRRLAEIAAAWRALAEDVSGNVQPTAAPLEEPDRDRALRPALR